MLFRLTRGHIPTEKLLEIVYGNNDLSLHSFNAQLLHEKISFTPSNWDYLRVCCIPVNLLVSHAGHLISQIKMSFSFFVIYCGI